MPKLQRALLCGASALAAMSVLPVASFAQDSTTLETVTVTGIRESLRDSLLMKQNATLITDNISTKDIGQLPDVTIAEELSRLPGVNTQRDRGNASQAAIRGMGPRLVFGLVNGREVASSEPSQDLRWEIYPSEVLSGAQVYKTQDASLVPGGIAATVDIRTVSPLDYAGKELNLRVGPTYNEEGSQLAHYDPLGLRGSAAYITHITDTFAVALAASFQREKNGFPDFRTWGWNTPDNSGASSATSVGNTGDLNFDGVPDNTTWGLNTEVKEITQDRLALMGAVGWRPTSNIEVKYDGLYSHYTIRENQFQDWFGNGHGNWDNGDNCLAAGHWNCYFNSPGSSYTIINNTVVALTTPNNVWSNSENEIARYKERHTLILNGLNVGWTAGEWDTHVDLSHSEAWRNNEWDAIYLNDTYAPGLKYDIRAGQVPYAAFLGGIDPQAPALQGLGSRNGESDGPEHTFDQLTAVTFDVTRAIDGSFITAIDFGGRWSDRIKTHRNHQGFPVPNFYATGTLTSYLNEFSIKSFTAPPIVYGNFDTLWPLAYGSYSGAADNTELMLQRTRVREGSLEGYVKAEFSGKMGVPVDGDLGVRVAAVNTTSDGFSSTNGNAGPFTAVSIKNSYTDVLPTLNLNFHLADDQMLRFGAGIAISRPPLDALTAGFALGSITPGLTPTAGGGNPKLKPYKADQVDLSYEWYFHEESLFSVALFYKHLENFIGASQVLQNINGTNYLVTAETNGKGGDVEGMELTLQSRFYFLPGFLQDFGVYSNYAYVTSDVKEFAPALNTTQTPYTTPYPMVGLAKHTAEVDLFYDKGGFETRFAMKYHSPEVVAPTWVGTTLKQLDAETIFDASVSYQWTDNIATRFQARNLTNEPGRMTSDNNRENLSNDGGYQVYGRSYLFDISVSY
ncbi:MAG: TonB-dependent receptor [Alphaproteobacteria bacterium]|nr:TonB-dependent receptor [Alphaproteobacteria bacterium]